jgi:hypothetical protein
MKNLFILLVVTLFIYNVNAQEKMYLLFEFMRVDNEQEAAYMETEGFWENIHKERVKNGDIIGWDLWKLQPGGEDQQYQYLTVNIYDDPVKMMNGEGDFTKALTEAYPDMSEDVLEKIIERTGKSRDLAIKLYVEQINRTSPEYEVSLGTVASLDLMKVELKNYNAYEMAENKIFKPMHQKQVNNSEKESWSLVRIMSPTGSDTYTSHMTVNMFKDYDLYFMKGAVTPKPTDKETKAINNGLDLRDLKYVYLATLIKQAR